MDASAGPALEGGEEETCTGGGLVILFGWMCIVQLLGGKSKGKACKGYV